MTNGSWSRNDDSGMGHGGTPHSQAEQREASILALGHSPCSSTLTVPPQTSDWFFWWRVTAPRCTAFGTPTRGRQVSSRSSSTPLLSAEPSWMRHFRGHRSCRLLPSDENLCGDYQQSRRLLRGVKLLPGDHITHRDLDLTESELTEAACTAAYPGGGEQS
ncbi:hypothetical protein GWK47_005670 [Chionoecetes opilio]|uniref:Uncharacterized protein n=1 Tax=Chionoecetes opilio TaxID=41210 RepID=A0A8J4YAN6_CHIOP|nr:hypothetical protein GWK47_005670 [Chionoecetes opilio]